MTFVGYWFLSWLLSFKKISRCCLCLFLLLWTLFKSLLTNSNHLTSFILSSLWASVKAKVLIPKSCLFATPWTIIHQAPLSMGFSRQEHCSGLPRPPPGDFCHPGIKPTSPVTPALHADYLLLSPWGNPIRSTDTEHLHHHGRLSWTALLQRIYYCFWKTVTPGCDWSG